MLRTVHVDTFYNKKRAFRPFENFKILKTPLYFVIFVNKQTAMFSLTLHTPTRVRTATSGAMFSFGFKPSYVIGFNGIPLVNPMVRLPWILRGKVRTTRVGEGYGVTVQGQIPPLIVPPPLGISLA